MATLILNCSSADNTSFKEAAELQITYTALNGTLEITELRGRSTNGSSFYDETLKEVYIRISGTRKHISLTRYVDFNTSWEIWGATDTSWTGLSGTSISIAVEMPSNSTVFGGYTFTGRATMSWSTYGVSYDANGGEGAPSNQTKTHGTALTLSNITPTRIGYTFEGWNTTADGSGTAYEVGASYTGNSAITLYAIWSELTELKGKVVTIESLAALHSHNKEIYAANTATGLANLFADGETVLSSYQYGDELPVAGTVGRIFFKRLIEE